MSERMNVVKRDVFSPAEFQKPRVRRLIAHRRTVPADEQSVGIDPLGADLPALLVIFLLVAFQKQHEVVREPQDTLGFRRLGRVREVADRRNIVGGFLRAGSRCSMPD